MASLDFAYLKDQRVAATGRLALMSHEDLAALVAENGGSFVRWPKRGRLLLVVGENGWPSQQNGSPSRLFERARQLKACGYPIEFLAEEAFFTRLGLLDRGEAFRSRYTLAELARLLELPVARLRRWLHLGLIQAVETRHRLDYFDFRQVSQASRLYELLRAGTSLAEIRSGLEELRRCLPEERLPFALLEHVEHDGQLLYRLQGRLMEPGGQLRFDFEDDDAPAATIAWQPMAVGDASTHFEAALDFEDAGCYDQAAEQYRLAIRLEPQDAVLHFNLGNVLYQQHEFAASAAAFRRAVELDPAYVEAWNNLGNALSAGQQLQEAVAAFEHALRLVPEYHDARFNLALTLEELGEFAAAAEQRSKMRPRGLSSRSSSRPKLRIVRED